jgi:hypothetical protein
VKVEQQVELSSEVMIDTNANTLQSIAMAVRQHDMGVTPNRLADPLFILAPPRSLVAVVGAMLGQHPQLYGLPETHLLGCETLAEWWERSSQGTFNMSHGLLRAVAQLYFGEQTETSIRLASGWLRRRLDFTTGFLLEQLAERVHPQILVYKSPSIVYRLESLQRAHILFPQARFIHLLQHPRGHGEAVMEAIREAAAHGPVPQWMLHLASYPERSASASELPERSQDLDPQRGWYALNRNICEFLEAIPVDQQRRIRGEELLNNPNQGLQSLAEWLGIRTDAEAIEEMQHPERSPYACFGPPGARYGNDHFFLRSPALPSGQTAPYSLDGPLGWREDGQGFLPKVKELARQFGYE